MNCISFTIGDGSMNHPHERCFINFDKVMHIKLYASTLLEIIFEGNIVVNYKGNGMDKLYDRMMKKLNML